MKRFKQYITLENILCLFVILSPILDIVSFVFRNTVKSNLSISTFLRPIIPVIVCITLIIKGNKKQRIRLILIALVYIIYGLLHLYVMKNFITGWSYGNELSEFQYTLNFSFLIVYLIMYTEVFRNKDLSKLKKAISIMLGIYIASIYLAIITKTSSYTYEETQIGFKGWIESGNSLSTILLLSLFIVLTDIKNNNIKWKIYNIITVVLTGVYLTTLIGTRTGLLGFILVIGLYIIYEIVFSKNKKVIIIGLSAIAIVGVLVGVLGSKTLERRKNIEQESVTIIDEATGEIGCMTGDLLAIKNKILANEIEYDYMSEAQKESVIDLYNYSKSKGILGTDSRRLQLVFNAYLVKNQKSILGILFGNGYKANFYELVMENEVAAFIFNFGIVGFLLYFMPFVIIFVYSLISLIKKIKKADEEWLMYLSALALTIGLAWLAGYVFFATSNMVIISIISTVLLKKSKE